MSAELIAMAIYSCNVKSIGRTTHAPGTAGAHLLYVGREDVSPALMAEHMPLDPREARTWMNGQERDDRANARVVDKLRLALPRELDEPQRAALVQAFAQDLTQGRVPWYGAIHQRGEDAHNPHCHLVIRDRDIETGKRVLRLSDSAKDRAKAGLEPKAVEWVRARWEDTANRALAQAGHDVRIDRRTLEAQGIERVPTIHVGPCADRIESRVQAPASKPVRNRRREIDYPAIDQGRTRKDRNAEIIDLNLERAMRAPDPMTRAHAHFERVQGKIDRKLESDLSRAARLRTRELRRVRREYRAEARIVRENSDAERRLVLDWHKAQARDRLAVLRDAQAVERQAMQQRHGRFWARFQAAADLTGHTRRKRGDEARALQASHKVARQHLAAQWRTTRQQEAAKIADNRRVALRELFDRRDTAVSEVRNRHRFDERQAEKLRQQRECEREQARIVIERQVQAAMKAMGRKPDRSLGLSR